MILSIILISLGCAAIFIGCCKNRKGNPSGATIALLGFLLSFLTLLVYAIMN